MNQHLLSDDTTIVDLIDGVPYLPQEERYPKPARSWRPLAIGIAAALLAIAAIGAVARIVLGGLG